MYPLHGFGGAEKHVFYVAQGLVSRGHTVRVYCLAAHDASDEDRQVVQEAGIEVREIPYRDLGMGRLNFFEFTALLARRWDELDQHDVVHSHGVFPVAAYSFFKHVPVVVTTHGLEEYRYPHLKYPLAPFNAFDKLAARRNIERFIALSPGNRQDICRYLGVTTESITEVPNGVDTGFFRPSDTTAVEEQFRLQENVVVAVSRLVEYKGHGLLVDAVNQMEDTSLVIVGDGPFREELERKAGPDVHFAGRVSEEELPVYYSLGDVFVLPTFGEGMPLSILEAMACGTPVVSTDVGAIPDVVSPEVGRIVPPRDVAALRRSMEELFADSEKLDRMSAACRKTAEETYSWEAVARRTESVYEQLGGSRGD